LFYLEDGKRDWQLEYVEVLLKLAAHKSSFAVDENSELILANVLEQTESYV
jgi:hypothetical protein